jgi:hypothetical protein
VCIGVLVKKTPKITNQKTVLNEKNPIDRTLTFFNFAEKSFCIIKCSKTCERKHGIPSGPSHQK